METKINTSAHFDISAAVVKQLGEELVTDEVTAIMELVKNSYDACSNWVRIEIDTRGKLSEEPFRYVNDKGYIIIEDGGFGMNEDEIKNGWLVISLSHKRQLKEQGLKTPCDRTPLGDKGLGRLSTQRLGNKLEMLTSRVEENHIHHIAFNWDDFTEDVALTSVPTYFNNIEKRFQPKGTKLVIRCLKDPNLWEGKLADRVKGQLSQLIFPFKQKRTFHVYLTINGEKIDLDEIGEALRSQAVSRYKVEYASGKLTISGSVKMYKLFGGNNPADDRAVYQNLVAEDQGKSFFRFLTNKEENRAFFLDGLEYKGTNGVLYTFKKSFDLANLPKRALTMINGNEELADPGDFFGEIDDFNLRENDSLDSVFDDFSQFKTLVKNQKGIRVFRDGFGIKPFGIDGQDWLKLGGSWTSGGSYYGLKPSNVIGFISLSADKNKYLREKTDREGFMESPYSQNFFLLMTKIVDQINDLLEKTRRSYSEYRKQIAKSSGGITDIRDSFARIKNTSSQAKDLQDQTHKLTPVLARVAQVVRQTVNHSKQTKAKDENEQRQRDLLLEIDDALQRAMEVLIKVDSILEIAKKLEQDANYIKPKVEDLESQLTEFAELAGLGLTAEALSHEISHIVDRLLDQTNTVQKKIKGKEIVDTSSVFVYIEYVKNAIQSLRKQLSHLAPSLKFVRETKHDINLNSFIEELGSYYQDRFGNQIKLKINYSKSGFVIRMSRGKLTQIIDNIVLNSEYWLKDRMRTNKGFEPTISIELNNPFLVIYDNGPGIDPELAKRVFQPFVTGKPRSQGRGLGLFIVQQLLDTVSSEVYLLEDRNEHNRQFKFQINFSSILV
ncbi:ATP-binding protein [Flaviaesturariibacter aridisoli]|uniref:histidine kinase n=1 Tax=Flaviaesturariibacter aridisoli TaxID=2545761 RepID=A0A4V2WMZ3_9BACT|nr:ATP-binding protein [Flaviaesturariibacter aridisoli]TCZ73462.1 hypothetical protein E0486_05745 [Flaviaesturariibacter aridisoli]